MFDIDQIKCKKLNLTALQWGDWEAPLLWGKHSVGIASVYLSPQKEGSPWINTNLLKAFTFTLWLNISVLMEVAPSWMTMQWSACWEENDVITCYSLCTHKISYEDATRARLHIKWGNIFWNVVLHLSCGVWQSRAAHIFTMGSPLIFHLCAGVCS